jgi:hypothetical protein
LLNTLALLDDYIPASTNACSDIQEATINYLRAAGTSAQLRWVQDDIQAKMMDGMFALDAHQVTLTSRKQL